jgi:hypothetical protein
MAIKGWHREKVTERSTIWLNDWYPFVDIRHRHQNTVAIHLIVSIPGRKVWQVWANSAPFGEIGTATSREKARAKAVAFMKKYPGGHPSAPVHVTRAILSLPLGPGGKKP